MAHDRTLRSWLRPIAIGRIVLATWFSLSVLTFQDSPDDTPFIVTLLSK